MDVSKEKISLSPNYNAMFPMIQEWEITKIGFLSSASRADMLDIRVTSPYLGNHTPNPSVFHLNTFVGEMVRMKLEADFSKMSMSLNEWGIRFHPDAVANSSWTRVKQNFQTLEPLPMPVTTNTNPNAAIPDWSSATEMFVNIVQRGGGTVANNHAEPFFLEVGEEIIFDVFFDSADDWLNNWSYMLSHHVLYAFDPDEGRRTSFSSPIAGQFEIRFGRDEDEGDFIYVKRVREGASTGDVQFIVSFWWEMTINGDPDGILFKARPGEEEITRKDLFVFNFTTLRPSP
jgi:hypothetical protein